MTRAVISGSELPLCPLKRGYRKWVDALRNERKSCTGRHWKEYRMSSQKGPAVGAVEGRDVWM